jgi:hypothetical protein
MITMNKSAPSAQSALLESDLGLLECLRWYKKEFFERVCNESSSQDDKVLAVLRLEPTYQFAEFFYLLRARSIDTDTDIQRLAELQNQYIVAVMKDKTKMVRLGLNSERLLDAMFTADTMPRLVQNWRERSGAIDQSNLARFLALVMSTETCRKVAVACAAAGFLARDKTPYGTILVSSNGALERIFGGCVSELRRRVQQGD